MPPSDPNSQNNSLDFDDFIGILVAFATIGAILFWSFSRKDGGWNLSGLLPSTTVQTPSPKVVQTPLPGTVVQTPVPGTTQTSIPGAIQTPRWDIFTQTPLSSVDVPPKVVLPPYSYVPPVAIPQVQPSPQVVVTPSTQKPTIPTPIAFTDVPADYWAKPFVDALSARGILGGFADQTFKPDQPVTRAEYAAIVEEAFAKSQPGTTVGFKDVPENFWAIPVIGKATNTGYLKGYPNQIFKPDQRIPRVQVLVSLASGMNLGIPAAPEKVVTIFNDAQEIPQWAVNKVAAATENNLVVNYPDTKTLAPNREITRGEVAAMVHQALVKMGRLQPIQSENIVKVPR
ncbi:S-layer homology domain-containing protein [Iningainema tapete]